MRTYNFSKLSDDVELCVPNSSLSVSQARSHEKVSAALTRIRQIANLLTRTEYTGILRERIDVFPRPPKLKENSIGALLHSCAKDRVDAEGEEEEIVCLGDFGKKGAIPRKGCSLWTFDVKGECEVFTYLSGKRAYFYPRNNDGKIYDEDIQQMHDHGVVRVCIMTRRGDTFTKSGQMRPLSRVTSSGVLPGKETSDYESVLVIFVIFVILLLAIFLRQ